MSTGNPILDEIRQGNRLRPTKTVDKSKPAFLRADEETNSEEKPKKKFKKAKSAQPGLEMKKKSKTSDENVAPPAPPPPAVAPPPPPLLAPPAAGIKRASSNPALAKLGGAQVQAIDRDAFLNSIKGGVKLRKTETNDKSGLIVDDDMANGEPLVKIEPTAPCMAPPPPPLMAPPTPGEKRTSSNQALGKLGGKTAAQVDLGEFLNSIKGGIKLRKAVTNDKSGLIVDDTMMEGGLFKKKDEDGQSEGGPPPPPPPPPFMAPPPPPLPESMLNGEKREKKESNNPALKKLGGKTAKDVNMGELLDNIKGGIRLRKTETKDKSGLIVDETMLQGDLFKKKEGGVPEINISAPPPPPPPPPMIAPPPPPLGAPPPPRVKKESNNPALKKLGGKTAADVNMGDLLNNIKGGIKLRKTETKDKSGFIADETRTDGTPIVKIDYAKLEAAKPKPKIEEEISEEDAAALLAEMDAPSKKTAKKTEPPPEPKKSDYMFDEKNLHVTTEDLQKEIPTGKAAGMRALWNNQISKSPSPAPQPMVTHATSYLKKDEKKGGVSPKIVPVKARTPDPQPTTSDTKFKAPTKNMDVLKEIKRLRNAKLKKQESEVEVPEISEADAAAFLEALEESDDEREAQRNNRLAPPQERTRAMSTPVTEEEERIGFSEKSLFVTKEDLEKEIPVGKAAGMRALFDQSASGSNAPAPLPVQQGPPVKVKLAQSFIKKQEEAEEKKKQSLAPVKRRQQRVLRKQDSDFEMPELSEADAAALLEELENSDEEKSTADACYDDKSLHVTKEDLEKEIPSGKAAGIRAMFDTPSTSAPRAMSATPEPQSRPRGKLLRDTFVLKTDSDDEIPASDADIVGDLGRITHEDIQEEIPSGCAASRIAMWAGRESVAREETDRCRTPVRLQTPDVPNKVVSPSITVNGEKKLSRWAPVQTSGGLAKPGMVPERPRGSSLLRETTPTSADSKRAISPVPTVPSPLTKEKKVEAVKKKSEPEQLTSKVEKKKTELVKAKVEMPVVEEEKPKKKIIKKKKIEASPVPMMSFAVEPKKSVIEKVAKETVIAKPEKKEEKLVEPKPSPSKKSESTSATLKAHQQPVKPVEPVKTKATASEPVKPNYVIQKKVSVSEKAEEKKPISKEETFTPRRKLSRRNSKKQKSFDKQKSLDKQKSVDKPEKKTEKPTAKVAPAPVVRKEEEKSKRINPAFDKAKEVFGGPGGSEEPILRPTPRPFFLNKRQDSTEANVTKATFTIRSGFKK